MTYSLKLSQPRSKRINIRTGELIDPVFMRLSSMSTDVQHKTELQYIFIAPTDLHVLTKVKSLVYYNLLGVGSGLPGVSL